MGGCVVGGGGGWGREGDLLGGVLLRIYWWLALGGHLPAVSGGCWVGVWGLVKRSAKTTHGVALMPSWTPDEGALWGRTRTLQSQRCSV